MVLPSQLASVAMSDRLAHGGDRVRVLGADVDVALGGAHRDAGDGHALDEAERIAFHQHAVGEGAAVAFIRVAADVFLLGPGIQDRLPFDAGRETRAAAAAQPRGGDLGDDVGRLHGDRLGEAGEAAVRAVVRNRQRIGDAAARERQPLLVLEIGNFIRQPVAKLVVAAREEARFE